mmetsp:Transcript_38005/g.36394  ORF Transcript_38005/g.36394 Transcript_38005/m.36394 type:complete len:96 (-) Transcript_38005:1067-1354(-)
MNVNGKQTYKTSFGAFISLVVVLAFSVYAFMKLVVLIQKSDLKISSNHIVAPVDFEHTFYLNPTDLGIDIALRLVNKADSSLFLTPDLGKLVFIR